MHLVAEGRCRPLAFVLTRGHCGDGPQLERVLEQVSVSRTGVGRPRTRPDRVLADKAYTSPRRSTHRLRQRALQETQHRRTHHQPPQRLPRRRHPLRETRLHLPRHRHTRSPRHLAQNMIRETVPSAGRWRCSRHRRRGCSRYCSQDSASHC
ncbi:hypothetical protein [Streptomyces sp. NPDC054797]